MFLKILKGTVTLIRNYLTRTRTMLESAKENLVKMRWFGLIEYQLASKELFEYSFQPLRFDIEFEKWDDTHSSAAIQDIPQKLIDEITLLNHLDAKLYEFARELPLGSDIF